MPELSEHDRRAIDDLFIRYTCALDEGDVDTLVACFAEDGSLESPAVGVYAGRPAIRAFAERFARFLANGSQLRHVISNLRVSFDGPKVIARCYLTVFITRNGASRLLAPGHYWCELAKVNGEWVFQRRIVKHDHDYVLEGI